MHKTMVLFSNTFDFGIFRTLALHLFLCCGIFITKELVHNLWKYLIQI